MTSLDEPRTTRGELMGHLDGLCKGVTDARSPHVWQGVFEHEELVRLFACVLPSRMDKPMNEEVAHRQQLRTGRSGRAVSSELLMRLHSRRGSQGRLSAGSRASGSTAAASSVPPAVTPTLQRRPVGRCATGARLVARKPSIMSRVGVSGRLGSYLVRQAKQTAPVPIVPAALNPWKVPPKCLHLYSSTMPFSWYVASCQESASSLISHHEIFAPLYTKWPPVELLQRVVACEILLPTLPLPPASVPEGSIVLPGADESPQPLLPLDAGRNEEDRVCGERGGDGGAGMVAPPAPLEEAFQSGSVANFFSGCSTLDTGVLPLPSSLPSPRLPSKHPAKGGMRVLAAQSSAKKLADLPTANEAVHGPCTRRSHLEEVEHDSSATREGPMTTRDQRIASRALHGGVESHQKLDVQSAHPLAVAVQDPSLSPQLFDAQPAPVTVHRTAPRCCMATDSAILPGSEHTCASIVTGTASAYLTSVHEEHEDVAPAAIGIALSSGKQTAARSSLSETTLESGRVRCRV